MAAPNSFSPTTTRVVGELSQAAARIAASRFAATSSRSSSNKSAHPVKVIDALAPAQHALRRFDVGPALIASDAAVCRRSSGVIDGKAFWPLPIAADCRAAGRHPAGSRGTN